MALIKDTERSDQLNTDAAKFEFPASGYRPRIIVKFHDKFQFRYEDGAEKQLDGVDAERWQQLAKQYPGITLRRLITSASPEKIRDLVAEAVQRDRTYKPPNFLTYFVVDSPRRVAPEALAKSFSAWQAVQTAYVDPEGEEPQPTTSNPRRPNQRYLDPAPDGIDAEFAWVYPGGRGTGQIVIDLERGWTFDHEDLIAHGITSLHGDIRDTSRPHGTSVLGEICAGDNPHGCIGIVPDVGCVRVVSPVNSTRTDAIWAAIAYLPAGGVLLVETQVSTVIGGTTWVDVPVEVLQAEFDAIRCATARGIVVVEVAGNGGNDLDTFRDESGNQILNRSADACRDSGAIMVGAATSAASHSRLGDSNYGSRIDCYAWGENVDTTDSTGVLPFSTTAYTCSFDGTSAAAPIIAGAALALQGIAEARGRPRWDGWQMRDLLSTPATGTASADPLVDRIGVMPNLRAIIESNPFGPHPPV